MRVRCRTDLPWRRRGCGRGHTCWRRRGDQRDVDELWRHPVGTAGRT